MMLKKKKKNIKQKTKWQSRSGPAFSLPTDVVCASILNFDQRDKVKT